MPSGRFAPSPTADLHLGNLRTAMVAWLLARTTGSHFVLRLEDLDPAARRPEVAARQVADLAAIGIDWDGPVVAQHERLDRYDAAIATLTDAGLTYPCYCTRREVRDATMAPHPHGTRAVPEGAYPGTCRELSAAQRAEREAAGRPPALRLRVAPGTTETVEDRWHGAVTGLVDDLVLRRNDGIPAYNLAVVVDDAAQGVEEVARGDDLLASSARQAHLGHQLGVPAVTYAHVPLALDPDGERLSKRAGAVTMAERAAAGEDPGAVRSLLAVSLGLAELGEPVSPAVLLARFEPREVPRRPWVVRDGA
jgi:glutamyl-tRNA synthetase